MNEPRRVRERLESIVQTTDDEEVRRLARGALGGAGRLAVDPYAGRVERFHDRLRDEGDEDYLTALAGAFDRGDLPTTADTPPVVESALAEATAERNRLFWAAFLAEEAGEVASCLTSGEPPEDFEEEVADVLILCFAIADCFEFDMLEAFNEKMSENEAKPKNQDGTGKLPSGARDQWGEG
jgi:NTP pyrophosphatase (non-canonical NTP hydrolase)